MLSKFYFSIKFEFSRAKGIGVSENKGLKNSVSSFTRQFSKPSKIESSEENKLMFSV